MPIVRWGWIAVGVAALGGILWLASDKITNAPQATTPAGQANGVKIYIDPATGKIREPEQEELLNNTPPGGAAAVAGKAAKQFNVKGGGVGLRVGDEQMTYSVARKGPDGKVTIEHATGKSEAEAILKAPQKKEELDVR